MSNAYVETTVLTDLLLKPNTKKQKRAKDALRKYRTVLLPVYAIKECKAGPMNTYAWVHDKLQTTKSISATQNAISEITSYYKHRTASSAIAAASTVAKGQRRLVGLGNNDRDIADSYRLALESLVIRSWHKFRKLATQVVGDLDCYTEVQPRVGKDGLLDLEPLVCEKDRECCLAPELKADRKALEALRDAIPESSGRPEDQRRRKALKQLIKHPHERLDPDLCRALGDAVFAFFCPQDAVILTTNLRDHAPLAKALRKQAQSPSDE
jgi:hypothetical protein